MTSQSSPTFVLLLEAPVRHSSPKIRARKIMNRLFLIFLASASLSLIQAQQSAPTILPQCAVSQLVHLASPKVPFLMANHSKQECTLQAFSESTCTATNLTCVCKDPTYAQKFDRCETANCSAAEQDGNLIPSLHLRSMFSKESLMAAIPVTNAYAVSVCAPVGGFGHASATLSSTATGVSGTATPTGNGTVVYNSTTNHNATFKGTPVPFTGGAEIVRGCGVVILAGLLVGGMAVAF